MKFTIKTIRNILSIFIVLLVLMPSSYAQTAIEPSVGINNNYFIEDINPKDQKNIDTTKEKIKNLNVQLKGEWITKKKNESEYSQCVELHKLREQNAQKFIAPPKKTSATTTTTTTTTTSTGKTTTTKTTTNKPTPDPKVFDASAYYNSEKCFKPGFVDHVNYWQKLFKKSSCSFAATQSQVKESDVNTKFSEVESFLINEGDMSKNYKSCKDLELNQIKNVQATKTSSTTKAKPVDKACIEDYGYWIATVCASNAIIKEQKRHQDMLKKLEHPELYNCEFKEEGDKAVINNVVCVEFTERLGQTKVIGAKSGVGLLKAYIALIYRYAAIIVGLIAVLMIIISGIQISTGGEEAMTAAKKRLANALAGLSILFLSGAILYIINPNFFTF